MLARVNLESSPGLQSLQAMAAPYSTQFAAVDGLGAGVTTLYTVPAGYVAVVRDLNLNDASLGSHSAVVFEGGSGARLLSVLSSVASGDNPWTGRQVFKAGQTIDLSVSGGAWAVLMSGYLLSI